MDEEPKTDTRRRTKCRFPIARIKKIMQFDDDIGKVSYSAPIVISHAIEMFLIDLLKDLEEVAKSRSSKKILLQHFEQCAENKKKLQFLKEVLPSKK